MEAQQADIDQDAVWQLDQMEISTDEEECSREIPAPTATGAMEGGVRLDPTDLFDTPLTASDLPEDSSRAEKLSKMMTAALRHKPGDFQIELQPDGFVRLETLAQSAAHAARGSTWWPRLTDRGEVPGSGEIWHQAIPHRHERLADSRGHDRRSPPAALRT